MGHSKEYRKMGMKNLEVAVPSMTSTKCNTFQSQNAVS
jgi:hypothetical protein